MRRGAQSMTRRGPKVERSGVCHDLCGRISCYMKKKYIRGGTYAVIPDGDVVRFPFKPHLELVVLADLSEEEPQYCVRLGFGHAHYVPREACSLTQDRKDAEIKSVGDEEG